MKEEDLRQFQTNTYRSDELYVRFSLCFVCLFLFWLCCLFLTLSLSGFCLSSFHRCFSLIVTLLQLLVCFPSFSLFFLFDFDCYCFFFFFLLIFLYAKWYHEYMFTRGRGGVEWLALYFMNASERTAS